MQKLILLGLFLFYFEIQNVLGNELLEHFGKVPWGTWDPQLRPTPPATIVEPPPPPPIQDCWDGNKCQLDKQCGRNGKCKKIYFLGLGYVQLQKFKAHFQSFCLDN